MNNAKNFILGLPIILVVLNLMISILEIKLSKKDKLLQNYLLENENIIMYGDLIYVKNIIQAILFGLTGILVGLLIFKISGNGFWGLIVFLYAFMISVFKILHSYVLRKTTYLIITNKRLIIIKGIFKNEIFDYSLDKISNVSMYQDILGRIFGYAKVSIISVGGSKLSIGNDELNLKNAENFIKAFVSVKSL